MCRLHFFVRGVPVSYSSIVGQSGGCFVATSSWPGARKEEFYSYLSYGDLGGYAQVNRYLTSTAGV